MRLYLIRHPKPVIGTEVCYGRSDVVVPAHEHVHVAARLAPTLPKGAPIFSSPLSRCAVLAERLSASLDSAPPVFDTRLLEMDFGRWELRAWNDIPRDEVDAWAADVAGYRPGDGESVAQMAARVHAFHCELSQAQNGDAIVVAHAGTIRLLLACRHGASPAEMASLVVREHRRIAYSEFIVLDD